MSTTRPEIVFPDYTVTPDKNGKRHTSAELFMAVILSNDEETLSAYTTAEFAESVVARYACTNTSVNGACQFLRGVSHGSKLEFSFEFSDARPVGAVTALKQENTALKDELERLKAQIEQMTMNK